MNRLIAIFAAAAALITVAGCGGSNTYSPDFQGGANPGPSFTLSTGPASNTVVQGQSAVYTATISSSGGFSSSVALSVSGLPTGATAAFSPTSLVPAATGMDSTLTVTTAGGSSPTPAGTYTLTISATGGGITRQTPVTLVVSSNTGGLNGTIQ